MAKMWASLLGAETARDRLLNAAMLLSFAGAVIISGLVAQRGLMPQEDAPPRDIALTPTSLVEWAHVGNSRHSVGPAEAPAVLIVFADYQCAACRVFSSVLDSAIARYSDSLRVVYRHLPLTQIHEHAFDAARAAECAGDQDRFIEFSRALYAGQEDIGRVPFTAYSATAGVPDASEFSACMRQAQHQAVEHDLLVARTLGLSSTPSFIVNGTLYRHAVTFASLESLVRRAVTEHGRSGGTDTPTRVSFADPKVWSTALAESKELAVQWLVRSVRPDGLFMYAYDAAGDSVLTGDNPVRQLAAARLLAEMSGERQELLPLHRRNLDYVLRNWFRSNTSEFGYITTDGTSKLGANAMALRTLVASPMFHAHEREARQLADGILSLAQPTGALTPWFIRPHRSEYDDERLLTFYSGEAILALLEYAERRRDEHYFQEAVRIQEYYIGRYVVEMGRHYYPAYVPWHTMSLSHLYRKTNSRKYSDALLRLNDKLLEIQDTMIVVGRFYNPMYPEFGSPHSSSDGVYTEGLSYAYEVALLTGDSIRAERYRRALVLGTINLMSLQFTEEDTNHLPSPERAVGALRIRISSERTRIDNTQHTIDAYRKLLAVLASGEERTGVRE